MDPARAMTLLTQAASLFVAVQGKYEDLMSLSLSSEAEIRQSCEKNDSIVAAKKYLKAMDALSELERAMAPFTGKQTHNSSQPPQPAPAFPAADPHYICEGPRCRICGSDSRLESWTTMGECPACFNSDCGGLCCLHSN